MIQRIFRSKWMLEFSFLLPALVAFLFLFLSFIPINGLIGHDFLHQFTRFLIGASHFWKNGFSILHFTPYLCGGIGFFADPQSAFYSVPQFLTFVLEPWFSTQLTLILFYSLGYSGFVVLGKRIFKFSQVISHFGALLFLTNGFAFGHLFVGHLTHHSYMLLPWFIYLMLRDPGPYRSLRFCSGLGTFALLLSYLLYSGSVHMMVVFALTAATFLPFWWQKWANSEQRLRSAFYLALSLFLFLLIGFAKIYAINSYSPIFMIRGFDYSNENPFLVLWRFFWFNPFDTPLSIQWGEYLFGPWEYVGFLSKCILPLSLVAAFQWIRQRKHLLLIITSAFIFVEIGALSVGWGGNESLVFFQSYHNPIKLLAALIPIWILVALFGLRSIIDCWNWKYLSSVWIYPLFSLIVVGEFYFYTQFYATGKVGLGFRYNPQVYQKVKAAGQLPPVEHIVPKQQDWQAMQKGASSLQCYEPLFGYRLEAMKSELVPGPVRLVHGGAFNINFPACLVYSEQIGCSRWSRIPESDVGNFTAFVNGQKTNWELPWIQRVSLLLSGAVFALLTLVTIVAYGLRIRRTLIDFNQC